MASEGKKAAEDFINNLTPEQIEDIKQTFITERNKFIAKEQDKETESEKQERQESEIKDKLKEKEDWYQKSKWSKKYAATYEEAVKKTIESYLAAKATYDDWASRSYKSNKGVVYAGGDDIHGEAYTIGGINENRKRNRMMGAKMQMDEAVDNLKELGLNDNEINNILNKNTEMEKELEKGDKIYDTKKELYGIVLKKHKPRKGTLNENESYIIDVKYDKKEQPNAINMRVGNRFILADDLKKGIEIEQEHKETLEKVAEGKITPKEAIKEIAETHLEEDPNAYKGDSNYVGTFDNVKNYLTKKYKKAESKDKNKEGEALVKKIKSLSDEVSEKFKVSVSDAENMVKEWLYDNYGSDIVESDNEMATNSYGFVNKGLAEAFKKELVTYYFKSEFGMGISKIEGKLIDIGFEKYAQYDKAFFISLIPKGKKNGLKFRQTYNPFAIVIAGIGHPDPEDTMKVVSEKDDVTVSTSKHLSFSENWILEFNAKFNKYLESQKENIIADVRENKASVKDNTDWKTGSMDQKYIDYKLGTIILNNDGSYTVKYGVNEPSTNANTLDEAKMQLDEYTDKKVLVPESAEIDSAEDEYNEQVEKLDKQLRTDNKFIIRAMVGELSQIVENNPDLYPRFLKKMRSIPKSFRMGINPYDYDFGMPNVVKWLESNNINLLELEEVKQYNLPKYKPFETHNSDKTFMAIHGDFASTDELRPQMMGSNFSEQGVSTTNAHILLFTPYRGSNVDALGNYCHTKKCFSHEEDVQKGKYPNWQAVIPHNNPYKVQLTEKAIYNFLRNSIDLQLINPITHQLGFYYPDKKENGTIDLIGFNAEFLKDCIEAIFKLGHKEIEISFSAPNRAALIYPSGKAGHILDYTTDFALCMPVMLHSSINNEDKERLSVILKYDFETNAATFGNNPKPFNFDFEQREKDEHKANIAEVKALKEELKKAAIKEEVIEPVKPIEVIEEELTKSQYEEMLESAKIALEYVEGSEKDELNDYISGLEILIETL